MMTDYKQLLISNGLAAADEIQGVSEKELDDLEKQLKVAFPVQYKEFLLCCGNKAGKFANDSDFLFNQIKGLNSELEEMIEEEKIQWTVPNNLFVFMGYQGYQYHYFLCNGNDDPEIYKITDGSDEPVVVSPSFSSFIANTITQYKEAYDKYGNEQANLLRNQQI